MGAWGLAAGGGTLKSQIFSLLAEGEEGGEEEKGEEEGEEEEEWTMDLLLISDLMTPDKV